jgi:signal transduction histidine kinase/CheY-like chemotaxis protein/HPt (histidine-containing phosphotransfer) domain-containing protein
MESEIESLRAQVATLTQRLEVHEQTSARQATHLLQALEELERTRDELELRVAERTRELDTVSRTAVEAGKAKSDFLANMSHELRTPISGVLGMTELALATELDPLQRDYLETIQSAAEPLLDVIDDLLDFSKLEAGKIEIEHVDFSLRETVEDTVKSLALRAHQKKIELMSAVAADLPELVVGDPARVRRVILNLVSNAIKLTNRGDVVVDVRTAAVQGDDGIGVSITVSDTGAGIPADKIGSIFDAFSQADTSTTRSYAGTGLGLTISARLASLMGGSLSVTSTPGKGTTFCFTVALGRSSAGAVDRTTRDLSKLQGLLTLVVDDHPVNRRILSEVLTKWGLKPTCVESGAAALRCLSDAAKHGEPFSLVLLDAMMPEMDGFDVAQSIQCDRFLPKLTIMMLSSMNIAANAQRASELGIASYVCKPVRQSELLDAIVRQIGAFESRGQGGPHATSSLPIGATLRPLRILLAEDNPVNRCVATALLTHRGHHVTSAVNGREAVDVANAGDFDVILMDVEMPVMSGFEATALIHAHQQEQGRRTPIIAMASHAMSVDRSRCIDAGMDDYVTKPMNVKLLIEALGRQVAVAAPPCVPKPVSSPPPADHASRADLLAALGDDEELLADVVAAFLVEGPQLLSRVEDALEGGEGDAIARAAHTLKGCVSNFGAKTLIRAAAELEQLGRTHAKLGLAERAAAKVFVLRLGPGMRSLSLVLRSFVEAAAA